MPLPRLAVICAASVLLWSAEADAAVVDPFIIDMEGIAPQGSFVNFPPDDFSSTFFEVVIGFGDYNLRSRYTTFVDRDIKPRNGLISNNSDWMISYGDIDSLAPGILSFEEYFSKAKLSGGTLIERRDEARFNLLGLDISPVDLPLSFTDTLIRIVGYKDGDMVAVSIPKPVFGFETFDLGPEFRDLDKAGIYPLDFDEQFGAEGIIMVGGTSVIDNIRVSTGEVPHPIPVPASVLLLLSALIPVTLLGRRRSRDA